MILTADPKANYLAHASEIEAAIRQVLERGTYVLGPEVEAFERQFADYLGGGQVVGVANGTDALELALRAAQVGPNDTVLTVANTVTATAAAVSAIGARLVYADIDPHTCLLNVEQAEQQLRQGGIRAVIAVHLYGQMVPMDRLAALCREQGITLIEDCAQAHGATFDHRKAGTWGDVAAFSFYPTKNLGALGDGGAVYSRDPQRVEAVRGLRQYGWRERYVSEYPGRNSRLDELQAAILRIKLRYLDEENAIRQQWAQRYDTLLALAGAEARSLSVHPRARSVYHQYVIRSARRDELRRFLYERGILAGVLYPVPLHRQPGYRQNDLPLPETEAACREVLCLPCHPQLAESEVDLVANAVLEWART